MSRILRSTALAAGLAIAACSGGGDGRFDATTSEVRTAVSAGDRAAAIAAVDRLALDGLAAHEAGTLDDAELDEFASRVASVRAQIDQLLPTTTTTTTTTAPPEDDDEDDDKDRGKRKGHKPGEKDGEEDDD